MQRQEFPAPGLSLPFPKSPSLTPFPKESATGMSHSDPRKNMELVKFLPRITDSCRNTKDLGAWKSPPFLFFFFRMVTSPRVSHSQEQPRICGTGKIHALDFWDCGTSRGFTFLGMAKNSTKDLWGWESPPCPDFWGLPHSHLQVWIQGFYSRKIQILCLKSSGAKRKSSSGT